MAGRWCRPPPYQVPRNWCRQAAARNCSRATAGRPGSRLAMLRPAVLFIETRLKGAFIVDIERREDDRGFFGRVFCQKEFAHRGLEPNMVQANAGGSIRRGTVRGM